MSERALLIVEDDSGLRSQLRWSFDQFNLHMAEDRESALVAVKRHAPAVVTLDLGLPPDPGGTREGFATLAEILSHAPQTKVIVLTGNDDTVNAVKAIGQGAYDFYQKPVDPEILSFVVERAFRLHALEQENRKLARMHYSYPLKGVIAASPQMHEVCRIVERLASTDVTMLILGESGTGKEVIARALHDLSLRAHKPFVAVNAAAIPENLLESELFGHEKGAFTGAVNQVKGKFEMADGGTFFLDEIGDIPLGLQAKLLRVLQERVVERVGGRQEIKLDVRLICATHRDMRKLMVEGGFREDSVLPHQRDDHQSAAATGKERGYSGSGARFLESLRQADGAQYFRVQGRRHVRAGGIRLAGKCPRIGTQDQAGGRHGPRDVH